jgi:activator of HSP90 ATPase
MKHPIFRSIHSNSNVAFALFLIAAVFAVQPVSGQTSEPSDKTMMGRSELKGDSLHELTIHQEIYFKVAPQRIYKALLSSKEFSESTKKSFPNFTASSAIIDPSIGGAFSLFDGHIIGRILELVPNQRIVEAWRVVDWPAGVYSVAKFEISVRESGTQLIFDHTGFPEGLKSHLATGWQQHYWDALSSYLH